MVDQSSSIKAFMACSIRDEDKIPREHFRDILSNTGFDVLIEDGAVLENLVSHIKEEIEKRPIFVALVTRREALKRKGRFSSPSWVHFEAGLAKGKIVLVFVEEGVGDIGALRNLIGSPVYFNRDNLSASINNTFQFIEQAKKKFHEMPFASIVDSSDIPPSCDIASVIRRMCVRPNGHGVIEYEASLSICSENFKKVSHSFFLDDFVDRRLKINPLQQLLKHVAERYTKQSFNYSLLYPTDESVKMHLKETGKKEPNRKRDFELHFECLKGSLAGQRIKYAWGWSFPRLYNIKGKDQSSYYATSNVNSYSACIKFETGPEVKWAFAEHGQPRMFVYDAYGNIRGDIPVSPRRGPTEIIYEWSGFKAYAGCKYTIGWELQ